MKKYFLIISSLLLMFNSCSDRELDLKAQSVDDMASVPLTEEKIQMLLNGAYFSMGSASAYGTETMIFGDLLGDNLFVSNTNSSYLLTNNKNYNSTQNEFGFYTPMYNVIMSCNMVINSKVSDNGDGNVDRIKAEAKILRGFAYFTLVNYYSPSPTSGINQEYGVPIVLGNYDSLIQVPRSTVAEVYDQIISDLMAGANGGAETPLSKVLLSKTAAKLLLSRVYLTRRAPGDAELALQYANDVINNSPLSYSKIDGSALFDPTIAYNATNNPYLYVQYFSGNNDEPKQYSKVVNGNIVYYTLPGTENQPETIWELSMNDNANNITGVGGNIALPAFYSRTDSKKCLLFTKAFYDSFSSTDVRKLLLTQTGAPSTDNPKGYWTNKYPKSTYADGQTQSLTDYFRNIKVLRFSEAILNRIEALRLTGQNQLALTELNAFATSRKGSTYTGANLLTDILTERSKEFCGEGQRFLDLKRYNLPINRSSNCVMNCQVPANDKLFVLPMGQGSLNANSKLAQYPGYN